jgi:hypothetical protein
LPRLALEHIENSSIAGRLAGRLSYAHGFNESVHHFLTGAVDGVLRISGTNVKTAHENRHMKMLVQAPGSRQETSSARRVQEEFVCWSRMQAEAGQDLEAIIIRKELERRAGDGCFLWGVGNPPALIAQVLARAGVPVRMIFSIMKSRPKLVDVAPTRIVAWRRYIDARGAERPLPANALVTSRGDSAGGAKRAHYALMCRSDQPLRICRGVPFDPSAFRNAGGTGAPVGASQVTALLRRTGKDTLRTDYEANLSAWLVDSYWVRLTDPVELHPAKLDVLSRGAPQDVEGWLDLVKRIRGGPSAGLEADRVGQLL